MTPAEKLDAAMSALGAASRDCLEKYEAAWDAWSTVQRAADEALEAAKAVTPTRDPDGDYPVFLAYVEELHATTAHSDDYCIVSFVDDDVTPAENWYEHIKGAL